MWSEEKRIVSYRKVWFNSTPAPFRYGSHWFSLTLFLEKPGVIPLDFVGPEVALLKCVRNEEYISKWESHERMGGRIWMKFLLALPTPSPSGPKMPVQFLHILGVFNDEVQLSPLMPPVYKPKMNLSSGFIYFFKKCIQSSLGQLYSCCQIFHFGMAVALCASVPLCQA